MPKVVEKEEKKLKNSEKVVKKGKAKETKKAETKANTKLSSKSSAKTSTKVSAKKTQTDRRKKVEQQKKELKKAIERAQKKTSSNKTDKVQKKASGNKASEVQKPEYLQEYYDLPYRYNETIVTILAQTPRRLFVYWDISDKDREAYRKAFGDDFFEKTYPVLLVHNVELNYTFEVPINDFANSWYLDIQDPRTNYVVQLGRKFKKPEFARNVNSNVLEEEKINLQNDFIYITDSNKLESPNDHILFELLSNTVKYRNVKNGREYTKNLKELVDDLYSSYPNEAVSELYTKLYEEELEREDFGRRNPASGELLGLPTSSSSFRNYK